MATITLTTGSPQALFDPLTLPGVRVLIINTGANPAWIGYPASIGTNANMEGRKKKKLLPGGQLLWCTSNGVLYAVADGGITALVVTTSFLDLPPGDTVVELLLDGSAPQSLANTLSTVGGLFQNDTMGDVNGTAASYHIGEIGAQRKLEGIGSSLMDAIIVYGSGVGRMRGNNLGGSQGFFGYSVTPASANYSVTGVLRVASVGIDQFVAIGGRIDQNGVNGYFFGARYATSTFQGWELRKAVGDFQVAVVQTTLLQIAFAWQAGVDYTLKLQLIGSLINCYVNGVLIISVTDSSIAGKGRPGYTFLSGSADGTGVQIDSISSDDGTATPPLGYTYALAADGDSLITDRFRLGSETVVQQLAKMLGTRVAPNYAIPGRTAATMVTEGAAKVDAHFASMAAYTNRIAYTNQGANDLANGVSAATTFASAQQWHTDRRAAGWITVGCTVIKNSLITGGNETARVAFNTLAKASPNYCDIFVDLDALAAFQDKSNLSVYIDGAHLTEAGAGIVAAAVAAAILAYATKMPISLLTADGAIPLRSGTVYLEKTSAGAFTLAAPTVDNLRVRILTGTNFAHVVTFTGSTLLDGTTGANITATFAAFSGAALTVISRNGKWLAESFNACTIA